MQRLMKALFEMPIVKLKGDRDVELIRQRRGVIAQLCSVIDRSRHDGRGPTQGRRLFRRREAIALGALFFIAMREVGMQDVVENSEKLATGLQDRLQRESARAEIGEPSEGDLIEAAEELSNNMVQRLEYDTNELW